MPSRAFLTLQDIKQMVEKVGTKELGKLKFVIAKDIVSYLTTKGLAKNRGHAVHIGNKLVVNGLMRHSTGVYDQFLDDDMLYEINPAIFQNKTREEQLKKQQKAIKRISNAIKRSRSREEMDCNKFTGSTKSSDDDSAHKGVILDGISITSMPRNSNSGSGRIRSGRSSQRGIRVHSGGESSKPELVPRALDAESESPDVTVTGPPEEVKGGKRRLIPRPPGSATSVTEYDSDVASAGSGTSSHYLIRAPLETGTPRGTIKTGKRSASPRIAFHKSGSKKHLGAHANHMKNESVMFEYSPDLVILKQLLAREEGSQSANSRREGGRRSSLGSLRIMQSPGHDRSNISTPAGAIPSVASTPSASPLKGTGSTRSVFTSTSVPFSLPKSTLDSKRSIPSIPIDSPTSASSRFNRATSTAVSPASISKSCTLLDAKDARYRARSTPSNPGGSKPKLPPGWYSALDSKRGRTYYWNVITGEKSWYPPNVDKMSAKLPKFKVPKPIKVERKLILPPPPPSDSSVNPLSLSRLNLTVSTIHSPTSEMTSSPALLSRESVESSSKARWLCEGWVEKRSRLQSYKVRYMVSSDTELRIYRTAYASSQTGLPRATIPLHELVMTINAKHPNKISLLAGTKLIRLRIEDSKEVSKWVRFLTPAILNARDSYRERQPSSGGISLSLRALVSKQRVRYKQGGFDLDLTYILPTLIAMGCPSEGSMEALYRNPMREVQRFFESRHKDHYKIFNLCAERKYAHDKFQNRVAEYPFEDHNSPPLTMAFEAARDIHSFISEKKGNVAAVHCKAGKGRTGTIISCYLLLAGICSTAQEALEFFGEKRTRNGQGVTIPSQRRYVAYFARHLRLQTQLHKAIPITAVERKLTVVVLRNLIGIDSPRLHARDSSHGNDSVLTDIEGVDAVDGAAILKIDEQKNSGEIRGMVKSIADLDPYISILSHNHAYPRSGLLKLYEHKQHPNLMKYYRVEHGDRDLVIPCNVNVKGDLKMMVHLGGSVTSNVCWCWIHTQFSSGVISVKKQDLDGTRKGLGKRLPEHFYAELHFEECEKD